MSLGSVVFVLSAVCLIACLFRVLFCSFRFVCCLFVHVLSVDVLSFASAALKHVQFPEQKCYSKISHPP